MSWPSIVILPPVGCSKPAIIRSVVVLPQPDGPRNETNSPRSASRLKSSTAIVAPNCFWTPLRLRNVIWTSSSVGARDLDPGPRRAAEQGDDAHGDPGQ